MGKAGYMEKINETAITAPIALEDMEFVKKSKQEADKYDWLYHCTTVEAMLNMIKSKEVWLSNLKVVNDSEEANRIDAKEYEKAYYVVCFTYDDDIPDEHWHEYGQSKQKVLFGMRKSWFEKNIYFLNVDHSKNDEEIFRILNSCKEAFDYQMKNASAGKIVSAPYYVIDFGFYKIIYSDELKKNMQSKTIWNIDGGGLIGDAIVFGIPGIIKSTHGMCCRNGKEPYEKNWESEKEVRLKIGVFTENKEIRKSGLFFRQMAVKLNQTAFDELPIKFCPEMTGEDKARVIAQIKDELPETKIYEI